MNEKYIKALKAAIKSTEDPNIWSPLMHLKNRIQNGEMPEIKTHQSHYRGFSRRKSYVSCQQMTSRILGFQLYDPASKASLTPIPEVLPKWALKQLKNQDLKTAVRVEHVPHKGSEYKNKMHSRKCPEGKRKRHTENFSNNPLNFASKLHRQSSLLLYALSGASLVDDRNTHSHKVPKNAQYSKWRIQEEPMGLYLTILVYS